MVLLTTVSLPGMGVAEITTVSPGMILTSLWSRLAMRTRADVGSPWLPVVIIITFSGGSPLISLRVAMTSGEVER